MLFLAHLFSKAKIEPRSKSAHEAECARLLGQIRATRRFDQEHAQRTAMAILNRLGVEMVAP
jgi:hypothetical protein